MFDYLIPLPPLLVAFVFVLWYTLRRRACPDCGALLPILYSPFHKTRRMWRAGGYLSARCGCETNTEGRKVTAGTAMPPFPTRQLALVLVLLLIGLGLGAAGWSLAARAPAAAPAIVLPQQAPPARCSAAAPPAVVAFQQCRPRPRQLTPTPNLSTGRRSTHSTSRSLSPSAFNSIFLIEQHIRQDRFPSRKPAKTHLRFLLNVAPACDILAVHELLAHQPAGAPQAGNRNPRARISNNGVSLLPLVRRTSRLVAIMHQLLNLLCA